MSASSQGGALASAQVRRERREEGLAAARQWREDNKARFDAIYGPEHCPACGKRRS